MYTCKNCTTNLTQAAHAQTINGTNKVCPDCFSENIIEVRTADDALEAMLAEIRRATKVREFVLGGFAK